MKKLAIALLVFFCLSLLATSVLADRASQPWHTILVLKSGVPVTNKSFKAVNQHGDVYAISRTNGSGILRFRAPQGAVAGIAKNLTPVNSYWRTVFDKNNYAKVEIGPWGPFPLVVSKDKAGAVVVELTNMAEKTNIRPPVTPQGL